MPFCPLFLLVNWITASQCDPLSVTRWLLTVRCRLFDPGGSRRRSGGPQGLTATMPHSPRDQASATALRCEPSIFFSWRWPSVPQTSARRQTQCTGLPALSGTYKSISLPVWPQFTLTTHDKANVFQLCLLCCFLSKLFEWKLRSDLIAVSCLLLQGGNK